MIVESRFLWCGTNPKILTALLVTATVPLVASWLALALAGGSIVAANQGVLAIMVAMTAFWGLMLAGLLKTSAFRGRMVRLSTTSREMSTEGQCDCAKGERHASVGASGRANCLLTEQLRREIEEISHSRHRLLTGHEAFRRELASELHGPVQTRLLLLSYRLDQIQSARADHGRAAEGDEEALGEIRRELTEIRERLRDASHRLYPAIVRFGLISALRSLAERFEVYLPVRLRVGGDPSLETVFGSRDGDFTLGISKEATVGVYRSVEEALCNVVKHAQANSVIIDITLPAPHTLAVAVTDDGKGFDPSRTSEGIGLGMIQDYVQTLGGACRIESGPGRGTSIHMTVPLTTPSEDMMPAPAARTAAGIR